MRDRIEIFAEANMIDKETKCFLLNLVQKLEDDYLIEKEKGQMFISHLVIALQRVKDGDYIGFMENEIFSDVQRHEKYKIANELMEEIEKSYQIQFPESEKQFIIMHLCNML